MNYRTLATQSVQLLAEASPSVRLFIEFAVGALVKAAPGVPSQIIMRPGIPAAHAEAGHTLVVRGPRPVYAIRDDQESTITFMLPGEA